MEPAFPPFPRLASDGRHHVVDVTDEPIDFTLVPRRCKRRDDRTEIAQRDLIACPECTSSPP